MKSKFVLSVAILAIAMLVRPAEATPIGTSGVHGLDFAFTFNNVPVAAQAVAMEAAHRISNTLTVGAAIPNQTISVQLTHAALDPNTIGSASPTYESENPGIGFSSRVIPNAKAVTGIDANGAAADIEIEMSDGTNGITFDFSDPIATNQFDYQSTIMHEIIHTMGFAQGLIQNGSDAGDTHVPGTPGEYTIWDQFVGDSTGALINPTTFAIDVARWNTASVGGTGAIPPNGNGLYFYGPNAVAANGGNPVPLYSPASYEDGSSGGGHLDTDFYGSLQRLMNHASPEGPDQRVLSLVEIGMMIDIGYRVVPEPTSMVLLVLSFAGMATGIRRQRN